MKKVLSTLLVLVILAATLVSCGGGSSYVGKWESVYGDSFGMKVKMLDMITLELTKDGKAIGKGMGQDSSGTWKEEGGVCKITIDGETVDAKLENGLLLMETEGVKIYFSKDAKNFKMPEDVIDPGAFQ